MMKKNAFELWADKRRKLIVRGYTKEGELIFFEKFTNEEEAAKKYEDLRKNANENNVFYAELEKEYFLRRFINASPEEVEEGLETAKQTALDLN